MLNDVFVKILTPPPAPFFYIIINIHIRLSRFYLENNQARKLGLLFGSRAVVYFSLGLGVEQDLAVQLRLVVFRGAVSL